VTQSSASMKLAEEFLVIPYPFPENDRRELEAEYGLLLDSGIMPSEVTDMILYSLEVLLNKRKNCETNKEFDRCTARISDMLGRLLIFEEFFTRKKYK